MAIPKEKLQVDLLVLGAIIALRAMDVYSGYALLMPARSKCPREFLTMCASVGTSRDGARSWSHGSC